MSLIRTTIESLAKIWYLLNVFLVHKWLELLSILRRRAVLLLLIRYLLLLTLWDFSLCCMFCCVLLYVHSSFAINLMGKRELIALLCLSSWCLVIIR